MLFHPANLPFWLLLALGVLCLSLILFAGGEEDGSDFSGDWEFEVNPHLDLDLDSAAESPPGVFQFLGWLGFGQAPLLLLLGIDFSLWGILGWGLNVLWAQLAGGFPEGGAAWFVLLVPGLLALGIGRWLSRPLGALFRPFSQDAHPERLIGCLGAVTTQKLPYRTEGKVGQILAQDSAGNVLTVSAVLPSWATVIPRHNQTVLIIDILPDQQGYLAIAKDTSDEDKWLNRLEDPAD